MNNLENPPNSGSGGPLDYKGPDEHDASCRREGVTAVLSAFAALLFSIMLLLGSWARDRFSSSTFQYTGALWIPWLACSIKALSSGRTALGNVYTRSRGVLATWVLILAAVLFIIWFALYGAGGK
jgi:hypothetical protein